MGQPQGCDFAAINRKTVGLYSGPIDKESKKARSRGNSP